MKIYVGCAIRGLSEEEWKRFNYQLTDLKSKLRSSDHEVLDFHKKDSGKQGNDEKEVFMWDYDQCMKCDAMIAIASSPSTGMGMEMAFCLYGRKDPVPVFATAPKRTVVSKMVTGCTHPLFKFEYCDQLTDVADLFEKYIHTLKKTV